MLIRSGAIEKYPAGKSLGLILKVATLQSCLWSVAASFYLVKGLFAASDLTFGLFSWIEVFSLKFLNSCKNSSSSSLVT